MLVIDHILIVRDRISRSPAATQEALARLLSIERTALSRILSGGRPAPPDFEIRVLAAIDALESAEMAADEARDRVISRYRERVGAAS